jgi:hypothetical protein
MKRTRRRHPTRTLERIQKPNWMKKAKMSLPRVSETVQARSAITGAGDHSIDA